MCSVDAVDIGLAICRGGVLLVCNKSHKAFRVRLRLFSENFMGFAGGTQIECINEKP